MISDQLILLQLPLFKQHLNLLDQNRVGRLMLWQRLKLNAVYEGKGSQHG